MHRIFSEKKTRKKNKKMTVAQPQVGQFTDKEKPAQVRRSNIIAAKCIYYKYKCLMC